MTRIIEQKGTEVTERLVEILRGLGRNGSSPVPPRGSALGASLTHAVV